MTAGSRPSGSDVPMLTGPVTTPPAPVLVVRRADADELAAYRRLRHAAFVAEQGLFAGTDRDDTDDDPRAIALVAVAGGEVVGGVRLAPATTPDLGWWTGSRLVVDPAVRGGAGVGSALVAEACRVAEGAGALRFEALVQVRHRPLFDRLGWVAWGDARIAEVPHVRMRWPIGRVQRLVESTKAPLAALLDPFGAAWGTAPAASLGGPGFVGDDGAPVPGSDLVAACDAILPVMLERDPEWAGWCGVLVNVNDLAAMGAAPVGLLDAVAGRDASFVRRVVNGLRAAADAWGVPVLGGHTQLGTAPALAVTALGRAARPVPGGAGRAGDALTVAADTTGGWRRGWAHAQWDSTSARSGADLRAMQHVVADAAPRAAKDVSMAGVVGTVGMLAEAAGLGAELDVAVVPRPAGVPMGDWLTCFPGFGVVTADAPGTSRVASPLLSTAAVGRLERAPGVRLRWPDGVVTTAVAGPVTGLGHA